MLEALGLSLRRTVRFVTADGQQIERAEIDFVSFDELSGVLFGPPKLIRVANLFYKDGREEVVFVPCCTGCLGPEACA